MITESRGNRLSKLFAQFKTELKTTHTRAARDLTFLILNAGTIFDKFRIVHALLRAES